MAGRKSNRRVAQSPIAQAQSRTVEALEKLVRVELKPVLRNTRLRTDVVLSTSVGGGVIMQAMLRLPRGFNPDRLDGTSRIGAVLATTIPLVDPVTLNALEPGAYAWGVRRISADAFAFDFFNRKGAPALSTVAQQKDDAGEGIPGPKLDIETTEGGGDTMHPPGTVWVCTSLWRWKHCFLITSWPTRPRPR